MKQQLNEIRRMQQLAGIVIESTELEDLKNKPGFDKVMSYLEAHPEDVKKLQQAVKDMKAAGIQEALDPEKIKAYLADVGIAGALGATFGSLLGGVADPAHALSAILAGVLYTAGPTALISLPGKGGFKKDTK